MSDNKKKNLSDYNIHSIPDASDMSFVILVSEWNDEITFALRDGAIKTLQKHGVIEENIVVDYVPGSFELPFAAKYAAERLFCDAVICLGCVIQGETRHFEFINNAVANGITNVGLQTDIPVIFGVLTPDTWEQAKARAGGVHGNKGDEAAITAIKMVALKDSIMTREEEIYDEAYPFSDEFDDDGPFDDDAPFDYDDDDDDFEDDSNDFSKLN